jgi:hypothetical protein
MIINQVLLIPFAVKVGRGNSVPANLRLILKTSSSLWKQTFPNPPTNSPRIAKNRLPPFNELCLCGDLAPNLAVCLQNEASEARPATHSGVPLGVQSIRLTFGLWLALALEFQLAADILSTTVSPSLEALARLAIIAVIRTFLNYFLTKELEAESEELKGTQLHEASAPGD